MNTSTIRHPPRETDAFMNTTRTLLVVFILLVVTVGLAVLLRPRTVAFLALVLFAIIAVYLGFALADGRKREVLIELLAIALFLILTMLGLWVTLYFLAAGYFAHGIWDIVHHPKARTIQTEVPAWYALGCVFYDWIVGGLILLWWR